MNQILIGLVALIVFILVYFYIALKVLSFAVDRIKDEKKKEQFGVIGVILILFPLFYANAVLRENDIPYSWINFLYSKLGWLFGFSLIFLHLNYLIREAKNFLKIQRS